MVPKNACILQLSRVNLPLSRVFNQSFEQAKFHRIWKQSYMTLVFKHGDRHNVTDYHGITSLSAVSKLFEIIVCGIVSGCTKNYISVDQHIYIYTDIYIYTYT